MKLRWNLNRKGTFLSRTGLYSDDAFSLITSMKKVCSFGAKIVGGSEADVPYYTSKAMFFGEDCEIYRDYDGEIVINGYDDDFFFQQRRNARVLDKKYLLYLTNLLISKHLPTEELTSPDFSQIFMKLPLIKFDGLGDEVTVKKKDLFILKDFLAGKSLGRSYAKDEIDSFVGKPANALAIELRKDLESRIEELKSQYHDRRTAMLKIRNEKIHAANVDYEKDRKKSMKEEEEEIERLTAETESLISAAK